MKYIAILLIMLSVNANAESCSLLKIKYNKVMLEQSKLEYKIKLQQDKFDCFSESHYEYLIESILESENTPSDKFLKTSKTKYTMCMMGKGHAFPNIFIKD